MNIFSSMMALPNKNRHAVLRMLLTASTLATASTCSVAPVEVLCDHGADNRCIMLVVVVLGFLTRLAAQKLGSIFLLWGKYDCRRRSQNDPFAYPAPGSRYW